MIHDLMLEEMTRVEGTVPHRQSIAYMLGADVLLLIPGPGDGTMPGKTFEYLAARKPILAIAGQGAVRDIILSTRTGMVVSPDDVKGMEEALAGMHAQISSTGYPYPDAADVCNPYDRKRIAGQVARILHDLTSNRVKVRT